MRKRLVIAAVVLQVLVLGYMAGEREWILHTGSTVWLRTAPVDPRDAMRGDYVRLDYEISHVNRSLWRDDLTNQTHSPDGLRAHRRPEQRVYASLQVNPDGLAEVTALSDRKPQSGMFLRGKLDRDMTWGGASQVQYGVEAFFMEQGKARELEERRGQEFRGVPLNMEVAVGGNGIGVLKGYRWEALGITLSFDTIRTTNSRNGSLQQQTIVVGTKVELKNHGPDPVAIVDLPDGRSFRLICDARWAEPVCRWVGETNAPPAPKPGDVLLLRPGQSHISRLDLTRPEWFVVDIRTNAVNRGPQSLQEFPIDWSSGFRIEYRPPPDEVCKKLPEAGRIWHGRLRSRWFNITGNVD